MKRPVAEQTTCTIFPQLKATSIMLPGLLPQNAAAIIFAHAAMRWDQGFKRWGGQNCQIHNFVSPPKSFFLVPRS